MGPDKAEQQDQQQVRDAGYSHFVLEENRYRLGRASVSRLATRTFIRETRNHGAWLWADEGP